jgi:hypothetical protein
MPSRSGSHPAAGRRKSYPLDAHGFVRQCAWCRRVADAAGRYRLLATSLIAGASHGCCRGCAARFLSTRATRAQFGALF